MKERWVVVIGGGAAGMAAAVSAAEQARYLGVDCHITVIEKTHQVGSKIRISGGGKCNVTHVGTSAELLEKGFLRAAEQRFLRSALYAFSNNELRALLQQQGVATTEREDGKVFPVAGEASVVAEAFRTLLQRLKINCELHAPVQAIKVHGQQFHLITLHGDIVADAVIVATGGVSYRHTGTTGDGLRLARALGHTVVEPSAALSSIMVQPHSLVALAGAALRGVAAVARAGKLRAERQGDILFTHRGFSGPAMLSLSRDVANMQRSQREAVHLAADLYPQQLHDELEALLLQHSKKQGGQLVRKFLQVSPIGMLLLKSETMPYGTIPNAMVPLLMRQAALDDEVTFATLSREHRHQLVVTLKQFQLGTVHNVSLDAGEVSAGGVALSEVNPKSMESRLVPNLYFCGEVLDYVGEIGGYNLQAAFSTGWMAGKSAVNKLLTAL